MTTEREFQEAVLRAAERQKERKRSLRRIEEKAQESPDYALATALRLGANARAGRRLKRRYLWSRFGIKVYSRYDAPSWMDYLTHRAKRDAAITYVGARPDRAPGSSRERLLRAEAVVEHGGWEAVFRAVRAGFALSGPEDRGRMACKFAFEAMRQSPALWSFFIEKEREPDDSVREHALAELAGWHDMETRLYGRTRKAIGSREEKLMKLASAAAAAWHDLQAGEPFWLPNTFVKEFGQQRKKESLAGRGSSYVDAPFRFEGVESGDVDLENAGPEEEGFAAFEARESVQQQLDEFEEKADLSAREEEVWRLLRQGKSYPVIASVLNIRENNAYQVTHNVRKKLRRAAGQ